MKKRSELLEPPYVFFIDRCLGKGVVPEAVRGRLLEGERVEILDDHFESDAHDDVWLADVGERRWVVLSQDRNIARNPLELRTLLAAKVAFFGLARGEAPGPEKAAAVARATEGIRRALRRFGLPLIATIFSNGDLAVKWAGGQRLATPRRIAAAVPRR